MFSSPRSRAVLAVLGGCVLIAIAVVYLVEPAHALPAFFPGHVGAGDPEYGHHHVKHALAALAVACAAFAYAWFHSGPSAAAPQRPSTG